MSTIDLVLYGLAAFILFGLAYGTADYFRLFKKSWIELEADTNIKFAKFGLICDCWITSFALAVCVIFLVLGYSLSYAFFLDISDNDLHLIEVQIAKSVKVLLNDYPITIKFTVFLMLLINTVGSVISAYFWLKRHNKKSGSDLFKKNFSLRLIGYLYTILPLILITLAFLET